ncbi:MAG: response regulator [Candidatus Cloacimonetes bacterium]|nr:response regulator [Candidatus Cloacimonadota bacterium]
MDKHVKILVIDDDQALLDGISLSIQNYTDYKVDSCNDPVEAMRWLYTNDYSAVISDVNMPKMNGLQVVSVVSKYDEKIPVILITGFSDTEIMRKAIHLGVYEFLRKPFEISELIVSAKKAVEAYQLRVQNQLYHDHLELLVQQRTIELFAAKSKLEKSYINTIHAMVNAMEVNDIYTRGHSERVTVIAMQLGKLMQIQKEELRQLRIGALLHDLGKIGILSNVLNKEQNLTTSEYDIIKQHPIIGAKIINPIGLPETISRIILQHHEWANGAGYPYGICLNEIHPLARIVSVADSFDAMTSQRPYRKKLTYKEAAKEVFDNFNIQFDPEVGKVFVNHQQDIFEKLKNSDALNNLLQETI